MQPTDIPAKQKNGKEIFTDSNAWEQLCFLALKHLLEEQAKGFPETRHTMPFPKDTFQVEHDFQEGDVFQRALIADTLLDINPILGGSLTGIIKAESEYLLQTRRTTGIGGWAYFPGLKELPTDADDLAQVMQVFIRYGFTKAFPYFDEPLEILLNEQANSDAWETWILPNASKTDEQELQTLWINKAWGTGSDPEVVANLIYALVLFDKQRFAKDINRGIQFLLDNHEGQYRWKSTWYYGNYYGTYVAVRALCAANADKSVIEGVINFIEKSRLHNGSWGLEGKDGDALQTALALLALSIAKKHLEHSLDKYWLTISYDYLQQTYTTQNGWPSEPFIQMPMGRPIGFVHTILTYESAAITNNYVAKAALHISQNHIL